MARPLRLPAPATNGPAIRAWAATATSSIAARAGRSAALRLSWWKAETSTEAIYTADELFRALEGEDAVVIAHVGGRYADLKYAHDGRLERSRRGAFDLGHIRMAPARRLRDGLPRRRGVPQRRPQGTPRRHPSRRIDFRRDRRPHLLFHAGAHARCVVRGAAQAAALRHDRHAHFPRSAWCVR